MSGVIGRQQRAPVHFESQEIADGVDVLRSVEAMDRRAAGIRRDGGRTIKRGFEPPRERVGLSIGGSRAADRRHRPAPELPHDLLPGRCVPSQVLNGERVERQAGSLQPLVVTGNTVPIQELSVLFGLRRREGELRSKGLRCRREV